MAAELSTAMALADTYARCRAFFASHPFTREKDEREAEKARDDARAALEAFLAEHLAGVLEVDQHTIGERTPMPRKDGKS